MRPVMVGLALLIAALVTVNAPARAKNIHNSTGTRTRVQAVQAKLTENKPQAVAEEKAPTEPTAPVEPEIVREAVATPQPPANGCAAYRNILAQYDWNVDVAIRVCDAESNGNPNNENASDYHPTCMGSRGLFQIGCDSTDNYAGMHDPEANIAQAYALYSRRSWQPWGSTTCAYKVQCY